jgi:hypothetical protein
VRGKETRKGGDWCRAKEEEKKTVDVYGDSDDVLGDGELGRIVWLAPLSARSRIKPPGPPAEAVGYKVLSGAARAPPCTREARILKTEIGRAHV